MKTIEQLANEYIGYLGANVLHQQQAFLDGAKAQRDIVIEELENLQIHPYANQWIYVGKLIGKLKSQK